MADQAAPAVSLVALEDFQEGLAVLEEAFQAGPEALEDLEASVEAQADSLEVQEDLVEALGALVVSVEALVVDFLVAQAEASVEVSAATFLEALAVLAGDLVVAFLEDQVALVEALALPPLAVSVEVSAARGSLVEASVEVLIQGLEAVLAVEALRDPRQRQSLTTSSQTSRTGFKAPASSNSLAPR